MAIRSVLDQTFDDFEIVVSNNQSADDSAAVALETGDPRIRLVETSRFLPSAENWEFARRHARGDYFVLIGDDDYLTPDALARCDAAISAAPVRIVEWGAISYFDSTYPDARLANSFEARQFGGDVRTVPAREILAAYFDYVFSIYRPHPSSVMFERRLAEEIAETVGSFYEPPFPEFTCTPRALARVDDVTYIDRPLVVVGITASSWGGTYIKNPRKAWIDVPYAFDLATLSGKYYSTGIEQSLRQVVRAEPERFADFAIDRTRYFGQYFGEILFANRYGHPVAADAQSFVRAVARLPLAETMQLLRPIAKHLMRETALRSGILPSIQAVRLRYPRILRAGVNRHHHGLDFGVADIRDCAGRADMFLTGSKA